ncbi:MAG: hypothetical protein ACAF41_12000 [Leptolyngbya sp. BL-A-14]
MKITKLSSETQAILNKMRDRRNRLDELKRQLAETDPADTQLIAKIHAEMKQIHPRVEF